MLRDIADKIRELRRMVRVVEWIDEHQELRERKGGDPAHFES